ncbi:hypothetical protein DMENIID0001_061850 [Sergentomyia squamirostris]
MRRKITNKERKKKCNPAEDITSTEWRAKCPSMVVVLTKKWVSCFDTCPPQDSESQISRVILNDRQWLNIEDISPKLTSSTDS